MGAGTRAAVRRRARAVSGCAERVRGPCRPPRHEAGKRRANTDNVNSKPIYAAISQQNNRSRKPITLARAIERLMVLDTVLGERRLEWLGAERDKVEYFSTATSLIVKELPRL